MIKKFDDLPEAIRNVLLSIDIENLVMAIGQENDLHIDEIGMLMDEIRQVLMGALEREKFTSEIKHMLDIEQDVAEKVTIDINKYIFDPLREELMQLTSPSPAPAAPPATPQENVHPDEIMNAISNPSSIPSPSRTIEVKVPVPAPASAPTQAISPQPAVVPTTDVNPISIKTTAPAVPMPAVQLPVEIAPHELKLTESVHIQPAKTDPAQKISSLIPPEVKDRINKDPYKETI